jgi:type III secretory pathway lipoprotein EscJ
MPDIIGVRIVTELRFDCNKILDLLRAFLDDLAANEVLLDKTDLEAQPQKMKNGLFMRKNSLKLTVNSQLWVRAIVLLIFSRVLHQSHLSLQDLLHEQGLLQDLLQDLHDLQGRL